MNKPKLTVCEQIKHMESQGIMFDIVSKTEAEKYLKNNTYYFKIKAYAKNFTKTVNGKYINLEFAYLQELAILDMHIRNTILHMCLQIEHYIKVALNTHISNNNLEDGYNIVYKYISEMKALYKNYNVLGDKHGIYSEDVINKYNNNFASWNLFEILKFGELCEFYKLYTKIYGDIIDNSEIKYVKPQNILYAVRRLRNACAHNNCLINNIDKPMSQVYRNLYLQIKTKTDISPERIKKYLKKVFVNDFITVYLGMKLFVSSEQVKEHINDELSKLFERINKHPNYLCSCPNVAATLEFLQIIVDKL